MKSMRFWRVLPVLVLALALLPGTGAAQGKIELGFHYSGWSINIIKGMVEELINDMAEDFKKDAMDEIQADNPTVEELSFTHGADFDSSGSNWGFELRWFPGGYDGSFSLGLSVEQTTMKIGLNDIFANIQIRETDSGTTGSAQVNAVGEVIYKPLSFHLHFRWDIWPSARVHPYFQFGFGMAGIGSLMKATMTGSYDYSAVVPGEIDDSGGDSISKTLQEIEDEMEEGDKFSESIPFIPFVQIAFGLRGEITKNIYLLAEGGIFNGIIWRGGLAFRF